MIPLRRAHGWGRFGMMIGLYILIGLIVFNICVIMYAVLRGSRAADERMEALKEEHDGEHAEENAANSGD